MSLLLDAMKKSGHDKGTGLTLEEHPNDQFASAAPEARPVETSRAAGQTLFSAKKKKPAPKFRWKLGLVPTTLLICGTIGAGYGYYVWTELNPPVQRVALRTPPPPPATPIIAPPPPMVPAIRPEPLPAPVPAAPQAEEVVPASVATVAPPAPRTRTVTRPRAPRLAIRSETRTDSVTPILQQAWQDYQRGNYASASEGYRKVLAQDIRNRDALLGMGVIAQQTGNEQEAQQFFHQVLLLDPRDPVALAAMTSYATPNAEDAEIRLRQMLANQPRSAALHYALGNVYLDQSRWAEAQQAYFTALALEPGSPQYSYNLAVSLDHLGQSKLAADYYRQTLQLDPSGRSGFDAAQAQRRLNELNAAR
ncbi:MAG: hypothetical protein Fur0026_14120 [Sideroxydans sp.]